MSRIGGTRTFFTTGTSATLGLRVAFNLIDLSDVTLLTASVDLLDKGHQADIKRRFYSADDWINQSSRVSAY